MKRCGFTFCVWERNPILRKQKKQTPKQYCVNPLPPDWHFMAPQP